MTDEQTPHIEDTDLNADAIYTALCYLRDYSKSDEWESNFRELLDDKSEKLEFMRGLTPPGLSVRPVPKFEPTPEFCEEIYPGEALSVEVGIDFGRWIIFGNLQAVLAGADLGGPIGEAVERFIADNAN